MKARRSRWAEERASSRRQIMRTDWSKLREVAALCREVDAGRAPAAPDPGAGPSGRQLLGAEERSSC